MVGSSVDNTVGDLDGSRVGRFVGLRLGELLNDVDGNSDGDIDVSRLGESLGDKVGATVGDIDGNSDGIFRWIKGGRVTQ